MRVLILAFDALEYELVKEWRLKNLMQTRYGKYKAAISPRYEEPMTPSAWTTIITGMKPEEHKIEEWWEWGYNRFIEWIRWKPPLVWIKGKRKILWKLGYRPKPYGREKLKGKTIFDLTPKSIALFVPAYSEPADYRINLDSAIKQGINTYIKTVWYIHNRRKQKFLENLEKDWELFMCWFDLADLLGHACITKCRKELWKGYLELARIVGIAKRKLGDDVFILIISDHGMKPEPDGTGGHSLHGFWSINKDWEWFQPREATDFYGLIKKVLEM